MSAIPSPSTITQMRVRSGRTIELLLILLAVGITALAYVNVNLAVLGQLPEHVWWHVGIFGVLALALHLVLRWRARYADPLMLPIATVLNGLGLVMIHRIDLVSAAGGTSGVADRQLIWTGLSVAIAAGVLILIRDHRVLRRFTYIAMAGAFVLLLLPMLPGLGVEEYGARLWIRVGPFSFQPGEVAKIGLAIFFAGYLVSTRDALSLVGRRVLGLQLPRGRDLGPILVAWLLSMMILVLQRDLGASLLYFGLFVAMLYVATERTSWIVIGLSLFVGGAVLAWQLFAHVQSRVTLWLDPFAAGQSDQVAKGLMGLAHGGIFGTGLGEGYPYLTYFANSDYIIGSFGEELGLVGLFAILVLYALLVERGLRTTPERMCDYWRMSFVAGVQQGSIGVSGHIANGIAALFLATGQDVACVSEASVGITRMETRGDDLYIALTLPNLIIGTVGGGTRLPTARECLAIMDCVGDGKAPRLAEIAAAVALAGEISIMGALCAGEFAGAHASLGRPPPA